MELRELLTEAERQHFRAQHTGTMPGFRTALINVIRLIEGMVAAENADIVPDDSK
jgi:hypothetical protein